MVRRIVAWAVALGAAGALVAGVSVVDRSGVAAAAAAPGTGSSVAPPQARCAELPQIEARLQTIEGKVATWVPEGEQREAAQRAKGHTARADAIALRITRIEDSEKRVDARLDAAEARCGSVTGAVTGAASGSAA